MSPSSVSQVVTIREAASMYYVRPDTIRYHLDRGRLVWRKATDARNGVILIELNSLVALYGEPQNMGRLIATI